MQSNIYFDWKQKQASQKMNISPTHSNKSQTAIVRKLSFLDNMDFDQSTDELADFHINSESLLQSKNFEKVTTPTSCFKKLSFGSNDDFALSSFQNKCSLSSFGIELDSYDNEDSFRIGSTQETVMDEEFEEEKPNFLVKDNNIQDISVDNNVVINIRRHDSLQIPPFSFEEKLEFFEEPEPKENQCIPTGVCVPLVPSLETCTNLRDPDLWTISSQTLINLMNDKTKRYLIIDCRFDYEYNGGHIQGAINIDSLESLERLFLINRHLLHNDSYLAEIKEDLQKLFTYSHLIDSETTNTDAIEPPILIFHCEFSQKRGPRALRALRNLDRQLNAHRWPSLFYSEVYILEDGYQSFYSQFPGYSCPKSSYVKMLDKNHKKEYAIAKERERKSWKKNHSIKHSLSLKTYMQRSKTVAYS